METFLARLPRSRLENRDLGNPPFSPSHMNTPKFSQRIEWCTEISETGPARSTGVI